MTGMTVYGGAILAALSQELVSEFCSGCRYLARTQMSQLAEVSPSCR